MDCPERDLLIEESLTSLSEYRKAVGMLSAAYGTPESSLVSERADTGWKEFQRLETALK